jgi:nitrite reductase/ring-hydroxylating ferredoxin subunit
MAGPDNWVDVGSAEELARAPLRSLKANNIDIALSFRDGTWGALSNACNHVGGPLGDGRLDQDYIICPWHGWKFQRCTGFGEPGFEADRVPAFPVRVEGAASRSTSRRRRGGRRARIRRTRSNARSSASPGRCGSPGFRPP